VAQQNLNPKLRFALGFVLGVLLSAIALLLMGSGHGTYAPMLANISLLGLIPLLGIFTGIFGPPVLWGLYFLLVPTIDSRGRKLLALLLITVLHLLLGCWFAYDDPYFARMLQYAPWLILLHGVVLLITLALLAYVSFRDEKESAN
jgi:hypothetical protein